MNRYLKSLLITTFIYISIVIIFMAIFTKNEEIDEPKKVTMKLADFKIEKPHIPKKTTVKKEEIYPSEKLVKKDGNTSYENKMLSLKELTKFLIPPKENNKYKHIKNLYGSHFEELDATQKEFLVENFSSIGSITQSYLEYPYIAARQGVQGTSVVEFFLYPNGDISEIKLIKSSGYNILDENSIETIEVAYKDYPRPKSKTRIRMTVHYYL